MTLAAADVGISAFLPALRRGDSSIVVLNNNIYSRNLGFKAYELKDHLGNVRVTLSDVKIPNSTRGQAPFLADMISKNEYYPFGMLITH